MSDRAKKIEEALRDCLGVIEILTITMEAGNIDVAARGAYEVAKHRNVEDRAREALASLPASGRAPSAAPATKATRRNAPVMCACHDDGPAMADGRCATCLLPTNRPTASGGDEARCGCGGIGWWYEWRDDNRLRVECPACGGRGTR